MSEAQPMYVGVHVSSITLDAPIRCGLEVFQVAKEVSQVANDEEEIGALTWN